MANVEAMFRAVYADPSSDAPRAALAAKLISRGDDRGEFIELQLKAARTGKRSRVDRSREKALREANSSDWLKPLRGALVKRTVKWERGFPVAGRLALATTADRSEAMIGAPGLATLERLSVEGGNAVHDQGFLSRFLFDSPLRGLKSLVGTQRDQLERFLSSEPPWALETLAVATEGGGGPAGKKHMLARIAEVARLAPGANGLPFLTDLSLSYSHGVDPDGTYRWLWSTPPGRRLVTLRMNHGPTAAVPWIDALARHAEDIALQTIEFFALSRFYLERTTDGWTRLRGTMPERDLYIKVVSDGLDLMAEKLGPRFEIDVPGYARP